MAVAVRERAALRAPVRLREAHGARAAGTGAGAEDEAGARGLLRHTAAAEARVAREGTVLALRGAPARFEDTLGALSAGAAVTRSARARRDLTLWFVRSRAELERGLAGMLAVVASGRLWLAWPKKTSGVATDLTENVLREIVLPTGWVDIKVCAIDATWSGLLFARRRTPPKGERDA